MDSTPFFYPARILDTLGGVMRLPARIPGFYPPFSGGTLEIRVEKDSLKHSGSLAFAQDGEGDKTQFLQGVGTPMVLT